MYSLEQLINNNEVAGCDYSHLRHELISLRAKAARLDALKARDKVVVDKWEYESLLENYSTVATRNTDAELELQQLKAELRVLRADLEELRGTLAAYEAVGKVKIARLQEKMLVYCADWERMSNAELYLIAHSLGKTHEANNFYATWLKAHEARHGEPVQKMHTLELPNPDWHDDHSPAYDESPSPEPVEPAEATRLAPNPPLTFEQAQALNDVWLVQAASRHYYARGGHLYRNRNNKWASNDLDLIWSCLKEGGHVYAHDPRSNGGQG